MELLEKQSLTAKTLSKKDIRNLERLKQKATAEPLPLKGQARIQVGQDDASHIRE